MQNPVSLTFHLHTLLGNRMVLEASGVQGDFSGKNPIQHAVRVHDAEIDALFPLNIDRRQQDGFRTSRL